MKRYDSYKESGVEWIGDVPEHWSIVKVSRGFDLIGSGTTPPSSSPEFYEGGDIPWVNTGDLNDGLLAETNKRVTQKAIEDYSTLKMFPSGSLIIAMYGATIGKTSILGIDACTNQACCVLANSSKISSEFAFYWFIAHKRHIISLGYGGGQPNISQELIRSLRIPCPSIEEQQLICYFLDEKTSQIDSLIQKKQQMIALLEEEKSAIINEAVTKGLNPDAPMKDSGIEWLGMVPAHWEVRKVSRSFSTIGSGTTPESGNSLYHENGTIPWVNTGDLNDGVLDTVNKKITEQAFDRYSLKVYPSGSLIIAMYGATIGKVAILGFEACTNQACCVLGDSPVFITKFAYYFFLANKKHIVSLGYGGGQPNISQELIKGLRIPAPSLEEQNQIIDHLEKETSRIEKMKQKFLKEISLMQEYRTALISEAVTGKIDVRDYMTEPITSTALA